MAARAPAALTVMSDINTRCLSYFIVTARWNCRRCGRVTPVHALVLPAAHETLAVDDDSRQEGVMAVWEPAGFPTLMFYVDYLTSPVRRRIRQSAPHYWLDLDGETDSSYFMNHCERCGAKQADRSIHEEYPGAFCDTRADCISAIQLTEVHEPLAARAAGFAIEPAFFRVLSGQVRADIR